MSAFKKVVERVIAEKLILKPNSDFYPLIQLSTGQILALLFTSRMDCSANESIFLRNVSTHSPPRVWRDSLSKPLTMPVRFTSETIFVMYQNVFCINVGRSSMMIFIRVQRVGGEGRRGQCDTFEGIE